MAFKFEGDLEGLNTIHFEFISNVLKELDYESDIVNVAPVGKLGDNYQSIVKRMTIKDFSFIAKVAMTNEKLRENLKTKSVFNNEILAYDVMLPKYEEYQKSAGIETPLRYAKCYGIQKEEPNELILLEDLNATGFRLLNRLEPLSDECVRLVIKDFAILHTLSHVLKRREPAIFDLLSKNLTDVWSQVDEMFAAGISVAENQLLQILDKDEFKDIVKGLMLSEIKKIPEYAKEDFEENKSVLNQGDAWTNNILFWFEQDTPTKSVMIDYQQTRLSNPQTDLNYLIFNTTDYETRSKNYHSWVNLYYKELSKNLIKFGLNPESIYTREQLDGDIKRYSKLALATGLLFNAFILKESDEVVDFKKEFDNNKDLKLEDLMVMATSKQLQERSVLRLRDRVNGLLQSYFDFGLL